jgi:hypothetical protein
MVRKGSVALTAWSGDGTAGDDGSVVTKHKVTQPSGMPM